MRVAMLLLLAALAGCARGPTTPAGAGGLVSVDVVSADVRAGTAHLVWSARPGVAGTLLIQRRLGDAPWKGLAHVAVRDDGLIVLDDATVQPGARYGYRVRVAESPAPRFAGEVSIEVPAQ